ncbi:MAG: KH domain-containing protein [Acidimicrobiia bacterium]
MKDADIDSSDDYEDDGSDLDALDADEDDEDLDEVDDEIEDEDDDEVGAEGNRLVGALPKTVLEYLARNIVDEPDGVFVEAREGRGQVELRLHVAPSDMGKVIGRRGRVAQALRQVVAAAGSREGVRVSLDIVD